MTILPTTEKLKVLLEKLRDFHIKFLKEYASLEEPKRSEDDTQEALKQFR